jgi:tetratricopeptide (TPR) repeat protein
MKDLHGPTTNPKCFIVVETIDFQGDNMGLFQNFFASVLLSEDEQLLRNAGLIITERTGPIAEGSQMVDKALSHNPSNPEAWWYKGLYLYLDTNRHTEAQGAFIKSMELCYEASKKCDKQSREYKKLLSLKENCLKMVPVSEYTSLKNKYDF